MFLVEGHSEVIKHWCFEFWDKYWHKASVFEASEMGLKIQLYICISVLSL